MVHPHSSLLEDRIALLGSLHVMSHDESSSQLNTKSLIFQLFTSADTEHAGSSSGIPVRELKDKRMRKHTKNGNIFKPNEITCPEAHMVIEFS